MVLLLVFVGFVVGVVAAGIVVSAGFGWIWAVLAYCAFGALAVLITAAIILLLSARSPEQKSDCSTDTRLGGKSLFASAYDLMQRLVHNAG